MWHTSSRFSVPCILDLYFPRSGDEDLTSLCCSSPSILVAGTKAELSVELRRSGTWVRELNVFPPLRECLQLGDICAGSYCRSLKFVGQTDPSFPGRTEKELLFSVNASIHLPSFKASIAFGGSVQISGVGWPWTLVHLGKVVKLPDEWNTSLFPELVTLNRDKGMWGIFSFPSPSLGKAIGTTRDALLGIAARPLPSLQSTRAASQLLVNFFTFSFHNLKIAR